MNRLAELLSKHGACKEARDWASSFETLAEAWNACERGDWMLWLAGQAGLCDRKELVLAACACARLALTHVPPGEERPRIAIEVAERWAQEVPGVTLDMVLAAADAAASATAARAASIYAAYAASATAAVANAATYAAVAASSSASASAAAYTRSVDPEYSAAKVGALKTCAQLIRARSVEGKWRLYE